MPKTSAASAADEHDAASILLVDDKIENLVALESILEPLAQKLVRATSGQEALRRVLTDDFALIVLDVQMPGMDGFETAALLKQRELSRNIPIIFVTAISKEQNYISHGYSVGAVDYMTKPLDPVILLSKSAVFVDLYKKERQLRRQAEMLHRSELREIELRRIDRERELEHAHHIELMKSEAGLSRFKKTLDAVVEAVLMFEPESLRCSYANRGALELLGRNEEELLIKALAECIAPEEQVRFRQCLRALRSGDDRQRRFETQMLRSDGALIPVEMLLQYVAENDQPNRFVCIARDITERKRSEAALSSAYEREKRIATVLQSSLIMALDTRELPGLCVEALYEPALEEANVGGDLYDAFCLPNGDIALVVGDVSGKGLQAAARIAEVKYSLRAILMDTPDPGVAVRRLNKLLIASGTETRLEMGAFIALLLVLVSNKSPKAFVSSAGAEPGLILDASGGVRKVVADGLPLGIDPEAQFETQECQFGNDDVLLMFTDGIVEARNGPEFFGDSGVEAAAKSAAVHKCVGDVARHVFESVRTFAGQKLKDDACLLVAKRGRP